MGQQLRERVEAYGRWKVGMMEEVGAIEAWLERHQLGRPEDELRIHETMETLRSSRLTLAFVGEFSRGKTELINALFFSDYGQRLLPSEPGRTTMCPTELFFDDDADYPYLRLLPIETRREDTSIAELKRSPDRWVSVRLDPASPRQMAETFWQIAKVKEVAISEAESIGLSGAYLDTRSADPGRVSIPVWRHALVNLPHPLLRQGLTLLDTPGLNALGSEPELTLGMLGRAQAVVFVLSADTGVTASDMEIWERHINRDRLTRGRRLLVVLNKVDSLWDELRDADWTERAVNTVRLGTARHLRLHRDDVYPLSAQKALVARVRRDPALLERSGILDLEAVLSDQVLAHKERLLRERVAAEAVLLLENKRSLLLNRLQDLRQQREELATASGRDTERMAELVAKARQEQIAYHHRMTSLKASQRLVDRQLRELLTELAPDTIHQVNTRARQEMIRTWTTVGLLNGMRRYFEDATVAMQQVARQAELAMRLANAVYAKFPHRPGAAPVRVPVLSMRPHLRLLEQLEDEAQAFRVNPMTSLTEHSFVVKKFFISLAGRVTELFLQASKDATTWSEGVMAPLAQDLRGHKQLIDRHLEQLREVSASKEGVQSRLEALAQACADLETGIVDADAILASLRR